MCIKGSYFQVKGVKPITAIYYSLLSALGEGRQGDEFISPERGLSGDFMALLV